MNAVWNSYGQLCGCPEIFKKSCKFFCRELDIRVPEIVESEMLQSSVFQDFFVEIHHDVRVVHLSGQGRGEQIWIVWMVVMFQDQQIHRCLRDGH